MTHNISSQKDYVHIDELVADSLCEYDAPSEQDIFKMYALFLLKESYEKISDDMSGVDPQYYRTLYKVYS